MRYQYCNKYITANKAVFFDSLTAMNQNFTSHDFAVELTFRGVEKSKIDSGAITSFLSVHAVKISAKTWKKKPAELGVKKPLPHQIPALHPSLFTSTSEQSEVDRAIKLLKSKGYKIYKLNEV